MSNAINYDLVRYAQEERIAVVSESDEWRDSALPALNDFCTISMHLYRGAYTAGTIRAADCPTRGFVRRDGKALHFRLLMVEPHLHGVLRELGDEAPTDWEKTDFVSLNFLGGDNALRRVVFQANGRMTTFARGRFPASARPHVRTATRRNLWMAEVSVPFTFLGLTAADFQAQPIPFDVVRLQRSTAAVTAWCPIPDQLPFNENYDFPVFCFGLLAADAATAPAHGKRQPDIGRLKTRGPRKVTAGSFFELEAVYTVGSHGLRPGGGLRFSLCNEVIECNRNSRVFRPLPEKDFSPLQWENPREPGYLAVECDATAAGFELERDKVFSVVARYRGGKPLAPGTEVRLVMGRKGPGIRAQLLSQRTLPLKWFADPSGNGVFLTPPAFPALEVRGAPACSFQVHAAANPRAGERFRLVLAAIDHLGNVAHSYHGEVRFAPSTSVKGLPDTHRFRSWDNGIACFDVAIAAEGAFVIRAVDSRDGGVNGCSNLIVTDGSFGDRRILFGDIHTHSQLSDGRLPLEEKVRELALHRGCDFWASTDHDHDLTPARIDELNRVMQEHNEPGRFTTLPGYEWTGSMGLGKPWFRKYYGHRNVLFREPVRTVHDAVDPHSDTPQRLGRALNRDETDCIVVNHFHCGDPTVVPEVERVVEVSGWCGEFKRAVGAARDIGQKRGIDGILGKGIRVAVTAGTDHGTEAYYTGLPAELTAVAVDDNSRDAVFEALRDGRTYATSGQKVLLRFTVNGVDPDLEKPPIRARQRRIRIAVGSAMPVTGVQLLRNGTDFASFEAFPFGVRTFSCTDTDARPKSGYYRVVVTTAQGHTAWSSPIFFELK